MKRTLMIAVLGLAMAGSALAQGGRGMGRGYRMTGDGQGDGQGYGRHAMLDLTETQQEQARSMRVEHLKAMKPYREQLAEKQLKLHTLRTAEKVDSKAINRLIDELGAIRIDMAKKREMHRQEFRALLTEEQRVLLDSRPMGGRGGRGGFGGRGMRGGRGGMGMHGGGGGLGRQKRMGRMQGGY